MLRILCVFLAVSGFILIFGGVDMIETSVDAFGMLLGFCVSMMGLACFTVCVIAHPADANNQYR